MIEFEDLSPAGVDPETEGYLRLWGAKLQLHIADVLSSAASNAEFQKYSTFWMFLDNETGVGSYHWICSLFGIDEDALRDHIKPGWRKALGLKKVKVKTMNSVREVMRWNTKKEDDEPYAVPVFLGGSK